MYDDTDITITTPPAVVRKTTTAWYIKDTPIVTEQPNGRYHISDWHSLDANGLKRVHAVLGNLLMDLAAKEQHS